MQLEFNIDDFSSHPLPSDPATIPFLPTLKCLTKIFIINKVELHQDMLVVNKIMLELHAKL